MSKSSSVTSNDAEFQQESVTSLTSFQGSIHSFQGLFKHLGRDKGLANYDRSNELETLLKKVINLNKDTLDAIDCLVYEIPTLGPYLGPSKYLCSIYAANSFSNLCYSRL